MFVGLFVHTFVFFIICCLYCEVKQSECFTQLADFSNYDFVMVETRRKNGHSTNNSPETSPSRQHLSELAMGANQNITRGLSVFEGMRSMMEQRSWAS